MFIFVHLFVDLICRSVYTLYLPIYSVVFVWYSSVCIYYVRTVDELHAHLVLSVFLLSEIVTQLVVGKRWGRLRGWRELGEGFGRRGREGGKEGGRGR